MISVIILSLALFGASAQDVCTNTKLCPDGWVQVDGSCFQFNKAELNWNDAQAQCKSQGAHLFEPRNADECKQTRAWAENEGMANFWIGVTDAAQEGTWVYASTGNALTFSFWNDNEPNDYDHGDGANGENCAEIYPGGLMNDNTCLATRNFICTYDMEGWIVASINYKTEPCPAGFTLLNDACYSIGTEEVSYADATAKCEALGAKVFEPASVDQHALIHDLMYGTFRGDVKYWIGVTRQSNGDFAYASTGKALAFSSWNSGEPNNSGNNENCVNVNQDDGSGKWNDWACDNAARYVCQIPTPAFEVKLKV